VVARAQEEADPPSNRWTKALRSLGDRRRTTRRAPSAAAPGRAALDGVNVVGHFSDTSGLAEATRSTARCLEAAALKVSTLDVGPASALPDESEPVWSDHTLPYDVTVVHDNVAHAVDDPQHYSMGAGSGHTVGFWYWELADLPVSCVPAFDLVDEVWVPSRFVRDALHPHTDKPVILVPPSLDFWVPDRVDRAAFGLPTDRFLFLTMASVHSVLERKNPLGVVRAFESAFSPADDVGLVVKITDLQHRPDVEDEIRDAASRMPVYILEDRLSRADNMGLLASVDAYVSLHRSEGFGLPIAEAMALGKPVVATAYSGSVDFTTEETAFLVPYEIVELTASHSVYPAGFHWAEPDIDRAAAQLRAVAFDTEKRTSVAASGQRYVRARCDPSVGGEVIQGRIRAIASSPPKRGGSNDAGPASP
jgi:glycosyltransferase involved in cell wall biosynthesis